ncbi:MAG: hypothetical protein HJJLKODD_01989 [Phycisphaerae bacterium]|nr:hypothetical protein [Phycisphaerae bacterium]
MSQSFLKIVMPVVLGLGLAVGTLHAQEPDDNHDSNAPSTERSGGNGFFSEKTWQAMLKRGAFEMAEDLDLEDAQYEQLQQTMYDRWLPFYREHNEEFGPVVDRMMQAMWDPDLPSNEEAAIWAKDALRLLEVFSAEVEKGNADIARMLTPEQVKKFRKNALEFTAGLGMAKVEFQKMADGHLDQTMWVKFRGNRADRRERYRQARERRQMDSIMKSPEMQAIFIGGWEQYVLNFIARYSLDAAQSGAAQSILRDVKQRAETYLKSKAAEFGATMDQLAQMTADERTTFMNEHEEVLKPIRELFSELQRRLETIPTDAQRTKAAMQAPPAIAQPEPPAQPASDPADTKEKDDHP